MELTEELKREWFRAILLDSQYLTNEHTKAFKALHGEEYNLLHSFYRLRHELNKDIDLMENVGDVQWITLTFDNKRDKNLVSSKRKTATRFLNEIFLCYEIVEEYGEDKNRYHIHGFGVFREGKGFQDFVKWPCRQKIQTLNRFNLSKKVKYLTKYAVKSLPRRRRSKNLVYLDKKMSGLKRFKRNGFENCYRCRFKLALYRIQLGVV